MNGSIYERELVGILSGNMKIISRVSKNLDFLARESYEHLSKYPFFVTRAAGSKGADLIAVRFDMSMIIEVKSSQNPILAFSSSSGKNQDQAVRLAERCMKSGLFLIYAFRLKNADGDPWRLFKVPGEPMGRYRSLYNILPQIEMTKNENFVMKWEQGSPLNNMLKYLMESSSK
ncbi:MAG: PDDEXK family nuclease [Cuniculiplasma sp.]